MKTALSLLLAFVMCLFLCACGDDSANTPTTPDNPTNPTTAEPTDPPHTHDWKAATCTEPKTCKTCGETAGNAAGHDWKAATCSSPKTCRTCGDKEGVARKHDYKVTKTVNATCTNTGYTQYTCVYCDDMRVEDTPKKAHNYAEATCSAPKTCKTCGETSGAKADHKDNGRGYCKYCNQNLILAQYQNKIEAKLLIPSSGTKNAYLTIKLVNNTGKEMLLSSFATGNGKLCYRAQLDNYSLPSGYWLEATYYRGMSNDWYKDKYYDMYLDGNSWAYTTVTIDGTKIFIKTNANGDTILGLSLSDIGVAS